MWSKITHALKPHHSIKEEPSSSQSEVLTKVQEQHPNMSMFHPSEAGVVQHHAGEPSSPSVHSKRNMFKRLSKAALREDSEIQRSSSPFQLPPSLPNKVRNPLDLGSNTNGSQISLNVNAGESRQEVARRSSFDMLRPSPPRHSQDTTRSVKDARQRPSLDVLREDSARSQNSIRMNDHLPLNADLLSTPAPDNLNAGSVRSILRDRNTPGTGQNVRFFSRDAYKVMTPDESLSTEIQNKPQPPIPQEETPFLDRLTQASPPGSSSPASMTRSSSDTKSRPKLNEIFSPLSDKENSVPNADKSDMSLSFTNPVASGPATHYSNLFDVSQQLDIPPFPPGLGFDVNSPIFESSSYDASVNDISYVVRDDNSTSQPAQMTSTPKSKDPKGKGKEKAVEESMDDQSVEGPARQVIDETIFHAKEKSPKLPPPLHERSQSFSFGQTVFYSMANSVGDADKSGQDNEAAYPSSDLKPSLDSLTSSSAVPTPPSVKSRSRSLSDTVFQTMLRSSPKPAVPEADINDDSSSGLVVYSGGPSEPDPFSANANTYYTPQTMIPTTPPRGFPRHNRKTSKEENLIISLQTQLQLRSELCAQYEADLKARDELVEILSKKLSDGEKDETKRKNTLRSWKKKVQELERACRQLEEEVEESRHESMERSVMDEASGEALRMLHRQIASLEREKSDWTKREQALCEEVETLEGLVRERSEDVMNLKETLWTRDECERELKEGIREAKDQIEMMGNMSLGLVDEEELKRMMMEKEQKSVEETQKFRTVEFSLRQELEELKTQCEGLEVQKARWEEQLDQVNQQLKTRDEEYTTLKAELEAQWAHTEKATEKIEALEKEKTELVTDRDALKADVEELETRTSNMEVEWNESENKRNELETELQEVWNFKDALEKERDQLEDNLHQEREHADQLAHDLQEREDRISELEQEHQFSNDNVARLEENLRQRDEELAQYTQRVVKGEAEIEQLREEMSKLKREHAHLVSEQSRALEEASGQQDQTKSRMEELVRAKAEVDVELKTTRDRLTVVRVEVERLRRQIHTLQQESADKDIKIVQMTKQHTKDKEDTQGLNIALDSKQQELELLKRKIGVRGTAGSTPAQPSKVYHRRDSSVFSATPMSRPPSVISDSGTDSTPIPKKERKNSSETPQTAAAARVAALGKSTRVNGSGASSSSVAKPLARTGSVDGSMGPPPLKPRSSVAGTPTPTARVASSALSRSSSAKAAMTPTVTPVPHRRMSSVAVEHGQAPRTKISRATVNASPAPSVVSEQDEKENVGASSSSSRGRSMIPALA